MELPNDVLVHSPILNLNGVPGTLVAIHPGGFYELRLVSKGNLHQVLVPVAQTAIVFAAPVPDIPAVDEIER